MQRLRLAAFMATCLVLFCAGIGAQQTNGSVQGRVTDPSGAIIVEAKMTLTNAETNVTLHQTSGSDGVYTFNFVPPGTYSLRAEYAGFKASAITGISVTVNKTSDVNVILQPGTVTESVEVKSDAEYINTQSAVVSATVPEQLIVDIPSASRNPLAMANMAPGVTVSTSGLTGGSQMLSSNGIAANVSGNRQQQNTFYLDGTDNSGAYRNLGLAVPNPEAIEEVQVVTSTNTAEFGKQPGGYFNIITKSGTNDFHGSVFFFGTNAALNANTYNNKHQTTSIARPDTAMKQYGGAVGGPIRRDKTFFFADFQRYQDEAVSLNSTTLFPTSKMQSGDFSEYQGQLYNPDTNQPIPGNNIAAAGLLDPVAVKISPVLFPTVSNLGNFLVWQFIAPPRNNEILGKIDHNISDKQRVQLSTFQTWGSTAAQTGSTPVTANSITTARQDTTSGRYTWLLSPNLILEGQGSMALQQTSTNTDPKLIGRDLSSFGAVWQQPISSGAKYLPDIEILNGPASPQSTGGVFTQNSYQFGATATWVHNAHNFKFGYSAERSLVANRDDHDATLVRFQGLFSNRGSSQFPAVPYAQFAQSYADFMMGRIVNLSTQGIVDYSFPAWSHYFFAQDAWRIRPGLTANYGLRYEYYPSAEESHGHAAAFVANHQSNQFPNVPLHIAFQGDQGVPPGLIPIVNLNFAPRVGFAWDVHGNGKMAVRVGYGLYFSYPSQQIRTFESNQFPVVPNLQAFTARLYNPWGTSQNPVFPSSPTPFPAYDQYIKSYNFVPPFARIIGFDPGFTTPRTQQWNATIERQIREGMSVTAGYVRTRGAHLLQGVPFNYARYQNTPSGQPPSLTNFQQRVLYPTMSVFSIMETTASRNWYDALQLSSRIQLRGLTARVSYVYAHSKGDGGGFGGFATPDEDPTGFTSNTNNPINPRGEVGPDARRNTFTAYYLYQLPFWIHGQNLIQKTLGGWQLSGDTSIYSGNPVDVVLGYDANLTAFTSQPQQRPDIVKSIHYTSGSKDQKMTNYFDVSNPFAANSGSSFAKPVITPTNLFGNLTRNALWGPGSWNSDLAILKDFHLNEERFVQVRMESYDFLNGNNLDNPTANMSNANYGKILTRSNNRTMQFGAKFVF